MNKIPTAKEMSSHLAHLSNLLCKKEMLQSESKAYLDSVTANLRKFGRSKSWGYTIDVDSSLKFVPIKDKKLGHIAPRVYIQVAVSPHDGIPPFTQLNSTIEVIDSTGDLQSRWHIDLANRKKDGTYQAGPLFHLQGGGHKPQGKRDQEVKVSIPRWDIPPMELILTCERIIANFYPDRWAEIKYQERWLELIYVAQQLCYPVYMERIQNCLVGQRQSVLNAVWATEWNTAN